MNKKLLSERDVCTKFITPALMQAGWDVNLQVREEVSFTNGKIIVRGKLFKPESLWFGLFVEKLTFCDYFVLFTN
ncbi:MAG: hypothetical protein Q8N03_09905 [Ignavibacteria bacterium]|nr:hypothetical protein [Ignavibacteria bacterium]